ncbi:MAG: exo-rhamnogalacturonan lyase family protein [Kiritimatiellia bacterium]
MKPWMWVCILLVVFGMGRTIALDIPLTVFEPAGVTRVSEPASGGIPLPWGQFRQDQAFVLLEGEREIPLQTLPLVVDEKGYLRWILLDFQTDLEPRQKKAFVLRTVAPQVRPKTGLKITNTADGIALDTGKILLRVSRTAPFSLFSAVNVNGVPVIRGGEVSYTDSLDGKTYVADKPSSVDVEYAGPLRATVKVAGRFVGDEQTKLTYVARITVWAGRSDVHVKYSLANSNEEHYTWRRIKDSSIVLKFASNASSALLGTATVREAELPCWIQQSARVFKAAIHGDDNLGSASWLHRTPGASSPGGAKAWSAGKEIWSSAGATDRAQGWIAVKVGGALVCVNDLYFVEDPPRRLSVAIDAITLSGIVEPLEGIPIPFADKHRWLADRSHLSSQYQIEFLAPGEASELSALSARVRNRLHVMAQPAWYFETGGLAVGTFGTQADELSCYDKWGWQYNQSEIPTAPAGQWRNMARWQGGDDNHYTSEQDSVEALLLMYLRTGSRSFFDACETWANYFMDLQAWRTDGWRFKDGGVWWTTGGPLGNSPQRGKDPVTGLRNGVPAPWAKEFKEPFTKEAVADLWFLANAKACYCHNWGEGIVGWFCITGDRDALETAIDCAEQNYDTQRRAFRKTPGQPTGFSRDFTRASYLINATRLCVPTDPFLIEASDYLARVYLERPVKEPRGFLNGPSKVDMKTIETKTGPKGVAKMKELGITLDEKTGELFDPAKGARWKPLVDPHTWMFPPLANAMEVYYRITGNEDAMDWLIAYGKAVAHVLFQKKARQSFLRSLPRGFPDKRFCVGPRKLGSAG